MMMSYWTEFSLTGNPGRGRDGTLPRWVPWQEDGEKYAVLDTPAAGGVRMATESEGLDDLAAAILADASYENERERCAALASLHDWSRERYPDDRYRAAGGGRCASFAPKELLAADGG